jgi:hypothetical protein
MAEFTRGFFLREAFEHLLREHPIVRVVFMEHDGLKVPDAVKPGVGQTTTFEYGLDLPGQIPDLEITEVGIVATLSIGRKPYWTFVPWDAVIQVGLPMPEAINVRKIDKPAPTGPRPKLKLVT